MDRISWLHTSTSSYPFLGGRSLHVPSVNKHSDEAIACPQDKWLSPIQRQRQRQRLFNIATFLHGHQAPLSPEERRQLLITSLSEALQFNDGYENAEDDQEDLEEIGRA
jgi:hypothetical protein